LRGLRPKVDIPIEYIGLRPGEKLHEELIYGHEHRTETAHPRVFQIESQTSSSLLRANLRRLIREFATGSTVDRQDFTAQLVDMASDLVDNPQSEATSSGQGNEILVGRRHTAVREATAPS
jgi:FlaA1/EpsC-like NDP-sugar epimerase